jgi:hypothetical protein
VQAGECTIVLAEKKLLDKYGFLLRRLHAMKSRIATGGPRTILISVLLAADSSEHSEESSAADFVRPVV